MGGILASLPVVSLLAIGWLYFDTHDAGKVAASFMKVVMVAILLGNPTATRAAIAITNLTMEQAVQIALTNHPHLAEAWANIESAKARLKAAGRLPNPDAVARMESAPLSSGTTSQAEYVAGISQTIPLGRRLSAARDVEEAGVRVRERELEAAALNLTKTVRGAFASALFASEVLSVQTNIGANIQKLLRIQSGPRSLYQAARKNSPRPHTRKGLPLIRLRLAVDGHAEPHQG